MNNPTGMPTLATELHQNHQKQNLCSTDTSRIPLNGTFSPMALSASAEGNNHNGSSSDTPPPQLLAMDDSFGSPSTVVEPIVNIMPSVADGNSSGGTTTAILLLQQLAAQAQRQQQAQTEFEQKQKQLETVENHQNQQQQMHFFAHTATENLAQFTPIPSMPNDPLAVTEALRAAIAMAQQQQQQISGNGEEKVANFLHSLPPILVPNQCVQFQQQIRQTESSPTQQHNNPTPPTSSSQSSLPYNTNRPIRSQRAPMKEIITLDDPNELEEFISRGEERCIADMRSFIAQFSLRQTTVAQMTGVSQPYISKLLNGNHRELSLRCRKNIYCWYLNCRRHPEKLAMYVQDPSTRLETSADGELLPQRRERYVFRPVLLRILETYFQESPFPDMAKRTEIANACNAHLQLDKKGNQLMPKEVVTAQVVANWFANKRKEMRRKGGGQRTAGGNGSGSNCASGNGNLNTTASLQFQQLSMGDGNTFSANHSSLSDSYGIGGGGSSSNASCSSSFSPTPPNSATFAQPMFSGENANLNTFLEDVQNHRSLDIFNGGSQSIEELLLAGQRQALTMPMNLQQPQQKPLLSLTDCPLLFPTQQILEQNASPTLLEQFLLLQQTQPAPLTPQIDAAATISLLQMQLAAAAALMNQPLPPTPTSLSAELAAFQAAKLMEKTAAIAAQNPQMLGHLEN